MSLRKHVARMQAGFKRTQKIYEFMGERFSVNSHVYFWRQKYSAIYLFSQK
jgi:hypothetical protein